MRRLESPNPIPTLLELRTPRLAPQLRQLNCSSRRNAGKKNRRRGGKFEIHLESPLGRSTGLQSIYDGLDNGSALCAKYELEGDSTFALLPSMNFIIKCDVGGIPSPDATLGGVGTAAEANCAESCCTCNALTSAKERLPGPRA